MGVSGQQWQQQKGAFSQLPVLQVCSSCHVRATFPSIQDMLYLQSAVLWLLQLIQTVPSYKLLIPMGHEPQVRGCSCLNCRDEIFLARQFQLASTHPLACVLEMCWELDNIDVLPVAQPFPDMYLCLIAESQQPPVSVNTSVWLISKERINWNKLCMINPSLHSPDLSWMLSGFEAQVKQASKSGVGVEWEETQTSSLLAFKKLRFACGYVFISGVLLGSRELLVI